MIGSVRGFRASGTALVAAVSIMTAVGLAGPAFAASPTTSAPSSLARPKKTAVPHVKKTDIHIAPTHLDLGHRRVGTFLFAQAAIISNTGSLPLALNAIKFHSGDVSDFVVGTDCFPDRRPRTLKPGESCLIKAVFTPRNYGRRSALLMISDSAKTSPQFLKLNGVGTLGYFMTGVKGGVATFGDAMFQGQMRGSSLNQPIVSITSTATGAGYWLTAADGGVFAFGTARFFGSTGSMPLSRPMVGMSILRSNRGYWLVGSDGGVFAFGRAKFFGSTGGMHLNQPIVGMVATRSGNGYWLVARDGGVFTFGDANFFGSAAGHGFGAFVGIAPTPNALGYWLSNSVGQVFAFGNAPYFGDPFRRGIRDARGVVGSAPLLGPKIVKGVINVPTFALNSRLEAAAKQRVMLP